MDLLERYLQAVQFWLPKRQKQDIVAELSEDLRSQIEEKQAELGRSLTDQEVEAILKRCGRPLEVASRYLPQRYLIGPTLFPLYRFVLAVVLLGCVVPRCLIWLAFLIADPAHRGYLHMENLWTTVLYFAAFTTLAFAIAERSGVRLDALGNWSPRQLPPARDPNRIPRINSLLEIAFGAAFSVWFAVAFWPRPVIDLYGIHFVMSSVWRTLFWGFVIVGVGNLALSCANLFRARWTRQSAVFRLLSDAAGSALFCWLFRAHPLVSISANGLSPEKSAALTAALNWWMPTAFPYVVLVSLIIFATGVYRIIRIGRTAAGTTLGVMAGA